MISVSAALVQGVAAPELPLVAPAKADSLTSGEMIDLAGAVWSAGLGADVSR